MLDARKVVVIGQTVAEDLFGTVDPVGKQITVGGVPFTVVGVLDDKGGAGFQDAERRRDRAADRRAESR